MTYKLAQHQRDAALLALVGTSDGVLASRAVDDA